MYYRYVVLKHNRKMPEHSSKLEKSEMFLFCAFLNDKNTSVNCPCKIIFDLPVLYSGRCLSLLHTYFFSQVTKGETLS